jgi:hypothetical protein
LLSFDLEIAKLVAQFWVDDEVGWPFSPKMGRF